MPVKELPKADRLSAYTDKTIVIVDKPLVKVESDRGYTPSYVATLADGRTVWLPQNVVDKFEGSHAGSYTVVEYETQYGTTGHALRNAPPK